ncbi:MAG: TolC family protein [Myxococcaceae bacterium]
MARAVAYICAVLFAAPAFAEPLTLEQAVKLARERNEQPQIANAQRDAANARVDRARAFFFPDLTVAGTYTRRAYEVTRDVGGQTVVVQSQNALNGSATISMVLFDARGIPLYRAAKADSDAAGFDAQNTERLIAFQAADAFLQTIGLIQVQGAAERRLQLAKDSLHDAQARFESQLVSSNDVTKAELDVANAEQQLTLAQNDVQRAELELGFLLAVDPPTELAEPQLKEAEATDAKALVDQALSTRPDLMALDARTRSAHFLAQEPLMRLLPTLGLLVNGRGTNEAGLSGHTVDGSAAVILSWTIFDGGERYADRHERLALLRINELNAQAAKRQTAAQVNTALVQLGNARAAVKQATAAVTAAQKNANEVAELYRQGLASALDAQSSRVQLFEAEVALARTRYGVQIAELDLRSATGLDPLGKSEESK